MRQTLRPPLGIAALVQERSERRRPGVWTELLVGELNLDGLARALGIDLFSHHWVNRAVVH